MSWLRRLSNTFRPARMQRDIDRELSFHLAERADELRADGLSDDEARRRARIQFGNPAVQRERTRDVDVAGVVDTLIRNVRYAFRALARTPGFTATVILTLALGIGANSAVFSAIDAVLLQPLPFPDADRLVRLTQGSEASGETSIAVARLEDWNRLSSTFDAITGYSIEDVSDTTGAVPERVRRATVAPRFLEVWGIGPALGRTFTDEEHVFGRPDVALISDRYWRRQLSADPSVLERAVHMGDRAYAIVGVLPASFMFPDSDVDWWVPEQVDAPWAQPREFASYTGVGRLGSGVTLEQARADLDRVQAQLGEQYPDTDRHIRARIAPLKEMLVGGVRGSLWLLFGSVSVLLLIACTNIAALLLSRSTRRHHEIAVRYALGASRTAVVLHLLTETAVLAFAGAAAGLLVAAAASAAFRVLAPMVPRLEDATIDARLLLYTIASAALVAVLCGLLPAFRSTRSAGALSHSARTQVSRRQSLQWLLVGVQVALSVTLLASAGLLGRSLDALSRVEPGFDPGRVLAFRISGSFGEEQDYTRTVQRINRTIDELAALAGVEAAATTTMLPGLPGARQSEFELVEGHADTEPRMIAESRIVSPSYFEAMQIPILEGELCRRPVDATAVTQVMVNRAFVDRYLPARSVVGLHFVAGSPDRIMGVVGDARETGIDRAPVPTVYACFSAPTPFPWFLVRTTGEPASVAGAVRLKVNELEPLRSVYDIAPLESRIGGAHAQDRLRTVVLALFAATALLLACLGIYGTLSYVVSLRRREIGLRLALGAPRLGILRTFLGQGLRVAGLACLCGLALALVFTRVLSGMLYGVSPSDPATLTSVVGIVLAVAALAAVVPATRAALVEPMRILREE